LGDITFVRQPQLEQPFYLPHIRNLVLRTPLQNAPRKFRAIRATAEALVLRTDVPPRSRTSWIEALCSLPDFFCPKRILSEDIHNASLKPEADLFVAAAHLNLKPVIQALIDPLFIPSGGEIYSSVFGSPYIAAAKQNNSEILDLLLTKRSTCPPTPNSNLAETAFHCLTTRVTSRQGNLDVVKLLLSDKWQDYDLLKYTNNKFKSLSFARRPTMDRMLLVSTQEIFSRVLEFRRQTVLPQQIYQYSRILSKCVAVENVSMLKWLVTKHPEEQKMSQIYYAYPVMLACATGQTEAVEILLDYTASVGKFVGLVSYAAAGGHLPIVKMLVERGYDVDEVDNAANPTATPVTSPAIVSAIELEHVTMFRYLRNLGAIFDTPETCGEAVGRAKAAGLESMLDILAQEGVDIDKFVPSTHSKRLCWVCSSEKR
jgi:hypothetical protein